MNDEPNDKFTGVWPYASSPCSMPELGTNAADPAAADAANRSNVMMWRKAQRRVQLERRRALTVQQRREFSAAIARRVLEEIAQTQGTTVSLYWPIHGEPDLRALADEIVRSGGRCALPVVIGRGRPLEFRAWRPGDRLERGLWNIPVPAGGDTVVPEVVIAPVVAFDQACYRLGYGGGYFDRTLSAMSVKPRALGIGYAIAELDTIYPQSHDIPMDAIVTECGLRRRARSAGLSTAEPGADSL